MTEGTWAEAMLAAALFAVDPGTGGMSVRALPGPVRDRFLAVLRGYLPPDAPLRRLPLHAADDRLLGGLDLPATLRAGRAVSASGLLAEADGGIVLVAMAERITAGVAARLGTVLDTGEVVVERDGVGLRSPAAIGVVALDESIAEDERPAASLLDRLAFLVGLEGIGLRDLSPPEHDGGHIKAARALLPSVTLPDDALEALCGAASVLGVGSMRALLLAVRAARAAAALGGRGTVGPADAMAAARLVLAPRATRLPAEPPGPPDQPADAQPAPETPGKEGTANGDDEGAARDDWPMREIVVQAARAALPAGLLARLMAGTAQSARAASAGRVGVARPSAQRGRPIGARPGELRPGARLDLFATLCAAAPWQTIRRRLLPEDAPAARVIVRPDDFRIARFSQPSETTMIFLVDASGSAAFNRLAEAKGAVEQVLGDCYARRDRVALIAFRGRVADMLLPPTNSLVRARRSLASLPGGGGTPLATGMDAAYGLADTLRRKGQTPTLILLSDGRANVARDGAPGRARAEEDALAAGRTLRGTGMASMLVDTAPRPSPQARRLAGAMGALYVPLPYADASALARAVRSSAHA